MNILWNWFPNNIAQSVDEMFKMYEDKPQTVLTVARKREKRLKSKKATTADSSRSPSPENVLSCMNGPQLGLELRMDWNAQSGLQFVDLLKQKLQEENASLQKQAGSTVAVIEDNQDKLVMLARVRERIKDMMMKGYTEFDVARLFREEALTLQIGLDSSGALTDTGGVLQQDLKLT